MKKYLFEMISGKDVAFFKGKGQPALEEYYKYFRENAFIDKMVVFEKVDSDFYEIIREVERKSFN